VPSNSYSITAKVTVVKDHGTFGGPNQWNLYVNGRSVQWMNVYNAEAIIGQELPKFRKTPKFLINIETGERLRRSDPEED